LHGAALVSRGGGMQTRNLWGRADVQDFGIVLRKPSGIFVPGEVVEGQVILTTSQPIVCRGLRVLLQHKAAVHWCVPSERSRAVTRALATSDSRRRAISSRHVGEGDNRTDYDGQRFYARERRTVWGVVFKTEVIDNAGANCVFGSANAPTEGSLDIPLARTAGSWLALSVLDYDWGKKDDELGECLVDVDALLAQNGAPVTLNLYRNKGLMMKSYEPALGKGGVPSQVVISAVPSNSHSVSAWKTGARSVLLRVHAALNLRSADMVGKNDVYCQAWEVEKSDAAQWPSAPLPRAPASAALPACRQQAFPFSFRLPANLPSSCENIGGAGRLFDWAYVRCSLYAYLDIAWRKDPSARRLITIVQPTPASLPRLLTPLAACASRMVFSTRCSCCCECCLACCGPTLCEDKSSPLGVVSLSVALNRSAFAPGEMMPLLARFSNETPAPLILRVEFVRTWQLTAWGGAQRRASSDWGLGGRKWTALEVAVPPGTRDMTTILPAITPLLPPDYHGIQLDDQAYARAMLPRSEQLNVSWNRPEPLLWATHLRITMDVPRTPFDVVVNLPIFIAALPVGPQTLLPPPQSIALGVPVDPAQRNGLHGAPPAQQPRPSAQPKDGEEFVCKVTAAQYGRIGDRPPMTASEEPVMARHPQEDLNTDVSTLTYSPAYFVAPPPAGERRMVPSPFAPTSPPVDVTALPPGSMATCPYTQNQFSVPFPTLNALPPPVAAAISASSPAAARESFGMEQPGARNLYS